MDASPSDSPNLFTDVGSPPSREKEDTISIHVSPIKIIICMMWAIS